MQSRDAYIFFTVLVRQIGLICIKLHLDYFSMTTLSSRNNKSVRVYRIIGISIKSSESGGPINTSIDNNLMRTEN